MITLDDIAKLANVSRRTVARALEDKSKVKAETYEKIMALIKQYDYRPNLSGRSLSLSNKKILFCGYHSDGSLFHNEIIKNAKIKAQEIERYNVKVDIIIDDISNPLSLEEQQKIVDNFDANILVTLPKNRDFPLISRIIDKAQEQDVPIIYLNMDGDAKNRLCYVGCDYLKSGTIAAGLMSLVLGAKGNIAIFNRGSPSMPSFQMRIKGFKEELAKHYRDIHIVYENFNIKENNIDYDKVKNSDIDGVYVVNPGDYSICKNLYEFLKERNIKIITNDLLDKSEVLLNEGIICAIVYQDPQEQAYKSLDLAYFYLLSKGKLDSRDPSCPLSILIKQCL